MRALALATVLAAVAAGAVPAGATAGAPRCSGAAARDPEHRCHDPRLRLRVAPTPDDAELTPNVACTRTGTDESEVEPCAVGLGADRAAETVAMLGDSHAAHWRAGIDVLARAEGWRVLEVGTPHCPFSFATPKPDATNADAWCVDWNRTRIAWLAGRPAIRTVLVSANARAPVTVPEGATELETRVQGFVQAFTALPASVERIVVLRDTPQIRLGTHDCVRRAMRRRVPAGRRCAVGRRWSLPVDAAVVAARRLTGRAARVVDLTPHFCTRRACLPVVGGVLVHKDEDHLTQDFARTLGPYLRRAIDRLRWPEPVPAG